MQQRKSGNGRPSGTDGSDFSYRMVVDSRYTKVAKGKSRLSILILTQAVIQLLGGLVVFYSISKESLDELTVSSTFIYFVSLIIGELGRKRSRVNLLKFYIVSSSLGTLLSIASVLKSNILLEVVEDSSGWQTKKLELLRASGVLVGLLVQILSLSTTTSLISASFLSNLLKRSYFCFLSFGSQILIYYTSNQMLIPGTASLTYNDNLRAPIRDILASIVMRTCPKAGQIDKTSKWFKGTAANFPLGSLTGDEPWYPLDLRSMNETKALYPSQKWLLTYTLTSLLGSNYLKMGSAQLEKMYLVPSLVNTDGEG